MTIDEMDLRHAIADLRDAYHNLDAAKYTPRRVRTSRRMQPRPGPAEINPPAGGRLAHLWAAYDAARPAHLVDAQPTGGLL